MKTIYISKEIDDSLIMTDKCLSQIFEVIKENYNEITINAKCLNGLTIETENICDIIDHENMNYNKILVLSCRACKKEEKTFARTKTLDIKIGISDFSSPNLNSRTASVNLESESERDIQHISKKIEDYILSCRTWYSQFSKINFLNVCFCFFIYFAFLSIIIIPSLFQNSYVPLSFIFASMNFLSFVFYGLVVFSIPPISILKKARKFNNYIFPRIFFLIGQQKEEYKKIEKIRSIVLSVTCLGIILQIIIGLGVSWLSIKIF